MSGRVRVSERVAGEIVQVGEKVVDGMRRPVSRAGRRQAGRPAGPQRRSAVCAAAGALAAGLPASETQRLPRQIVQRRCERLEA
jgi:hypothetical protein